MASTGGDVPRRPRSWVRRRRGRPRERARSLRSPRRRPRVVRHWSLSSPARELTPRSDYRGSGGRRYYVRSAAFQPAPVVVHARRHPVNEDGTIDDTTDHHLHPDRRSPCPGDLLAAADPAGVHQGRGDRGRDAGHLAGGPHPGAVPRSAEARAAGG